MTSGTLTTVLHEPMEVVTRIKHRSLKERTKLDTTMCQEGMSGESQESCPVPVSVLSVNKMKEE